MKLQNKVAIITGSSSGIGAATAILFAKEGAKVVINYLSNEDGAKETQKRILALGGDAVIIRADVSKEDEAKYLIEDTIKNFGTLDILVNNAGKYIDGDEWNKSAES